jgi:hypothetical protein
MLACGHASYWLVGHNLTHEATEGAYEHTRMGPIFPSERNPEMRSLSRLTQRGGGWAAGGKKAEPSYGLQRLR